MEQSTPRAKIVQNFPAYGVSWSPSGGDTGKLLAPDDVFGDSEGSWDGVESEGGIALLKLRQGSKTQVSQATAGLSGLTTQCHVPHQSPRAQRAGDSVRRQLTLAAAAGIKAVIFYSDNLHFLEFNPGQDRDLLPTTSVDGSEADLLLQDLAAGPVVIHVDLEVRLVRTETFNIIATTPGVTSTHLIGAHLDSVPSGPGINDNASGVAVLLETALKRAGDRRNPWRFCWWGGEEAGAQGSSRFVRELQASGGIDRIKGYVNLDMAASPNHVISVYGNDQGLEGLYTEYFQDSQQPWVREDVSVGSDHRPFMAAGIAVAGLGTWGPHQVKTDEEHALFGGTAGEPYDPNYHSSQDDLANVSWSALATCAAATYAANRAVTE
ncbi:M28 family peptidase [Streptomyces sp. TRM66268-LWL]|uniref:M28 family peptidase n=1 Tax=Streptomyces polyasparticus TaxID=2767826 RepID=A0ABR7SW29_9ACTN|nr:M28 family peptidase [Streptomyces polyasparticus]MBC9719701.1 M28 family peptidase [Streptomyces polyasparticus]